MMTMTLVRVDFQLQTENQISFMSSISSPIHSYPYGRLRFLDRTMYEMYSSTPTVGDQHFACSLQQYGRKQKNRLLGPVDQQSLCNMVWSDVLQCSDYLSCRGSAVDSQ